MKLKFAIMFAVTSITIDAQVGIGKSVVSSPSVSLEFGSANKGLILPWVISINAVTGVENGTMVFDLSDKKVKVKYASGWKDLSVNSQGTTIDPITLVDGAVIQNTSTEIKTAKASIGLPTSVPGILVLEDRDKAMVLPKVANPHLNIINPSPGMIVYDTANKQLAVFNGTMWSFWKP